MAARSEDLELAPAAPRRGGRSRILLIGGGAALALALAAGGAWLAFGRGAPAAAAGTAAHAAPAAHAPKAVYLAFDPPFVVNFEEDGVVRFLQVTVEALVGDEADADAVRLHMPVLRDRMILLLSSQDYTTLSTRDGKEQLRALALADLRGLLRERIGKDALEGLFFTGFVMQ